jgi:AcrR family transcriptional regulator
VSKGALYLYFASKEELFEEMCRLEPTEFREILYSTFDWNKDPLQSASEFFDKMMNRYASHFGLTFDILLESARNPEIRRVLSKTHKEYVAVLVPFMKQLQEKGHLSDKLDPHPLTDAVVAMWNGIETLVASGVSIAEAKSAWLEGFKAIFLQKSLHKQH